MKKEKTIKELLQQLLNYIETSEYIDGLCASSRVLQITNVITFEELVVLKNYIKENKPSIFSSFNAFIQYINLEAYYWTPGLKKPRIKWLKKHIKRNS